MVTMVVAVCGIMQFWCDDQQKLDELQSSAGALTKQPSSTRPGFSFGVMV